MDTVDRQTLNTVRHPLVATNPMPPSNPPGPAGSGPAGKPGDSGENSTDGGARRQQDFEQLVDDVRQALKGLAYGQVTLYVQDGFVVQVERLERKRRHRRPGRDS